MPETDIDIWDTRLLDNVHDSALWASKGLQARRYMHNRQWDDATDFELDERIHITNNVIRGDIERMVAMIMEGDPVMHTHGRGSEDFAYGDAWRDLQGWADDWTGKLFDSVAEVRNRVWMDTYTIGEGIEKVWWCPWEEDGLGMVVHEHVDPMHFFWDRSARSAQLRDSPFIIQPTPVEVETLEEEFPKLKGQITPDYPNRFIAALEPASFDQYTTYMDEADDQQQSPTASNRTKKAYRVEVWEKKKVWVTRYYMKRMGRPALMNSKPDPETGDVKKVPMSTEAFEMMPDEEKKLYESMKVPTFELSKGVMINRFWAERPAIHTYDESNGGHGEYPFARYSINWDPNQSHGHGEVEYLVGWQDAINRMTSRTLEAAFIANAVILAAQKGSAPKGELAKLNNLGDKPLQVFNHYPGQQIPQFVNTNPGSVQLYQGMLEFLIQQKNDKSNIQDVNRGAAQYDLSGKAVQALQSEADLPSVLPRRAIESGLRQATWLSVSCMQRYMRAARLIRITPKAGEGEPHDIFVGKDEDTAKAAFNLEPVTAMTKVGDGERELPTGDYKSLTKGVEAQGQILAINDENIQKFDLRLQLDTGRKARKDERMRLVQTMLQYVGPAAGIEVMIWAAELMDVPNVERLAEALRDEDSKTQIFTQLEQAADTAGMDIQSIIQMVTQIAQQAAATQQAPEAPAAPAAPAGPPAPPPGGPPAAPPAAGGGGGSGGPPSAGTPESAAAEIAEMAAGGAK